MAARTHARSERPAGSRSSWCVLGRAAGTRGSLGHSPGRAPGCRSHARPGGSCDRSQPCPADAPALGWARAEAANPRQGLEPGCDKVTGPPLAPAPCRPLGRSVGVRVSPGSAGSRLTAASHPQRASCGQCSERIWGLARRGYRCVHCRLLVHKRCHALVPLTCRRHMVSGGGLGPTSTPAGWPSPRPGVPVPSPPLTGRGEGPSWAAGRWPSPGSPQLSGGSSAVCGSGLGGERVG